MDILSRMLSLAEDIDIIQGIKISRRAPSITHMFFADDAMVFFRDNEESCSTLGTFSRDLGRCRGNN